MSPSSPTIDVGTQQQFTATGNFSDGTTQDVSNLSVLDLIGDQCRAVTTNSGLATGKNQGTTTITATFGSASRSRHLNVTLANLVSIAVKPDESDDREADHFAIHRDGHVQRRQHSQSDESGYVVDVLVDGGRDDCPVGPSFRD